VYGEKCNCSTLLGETNKLSGSIDAIN